MKNRNVERGETKGEKAKRKQRQSKQKVKRNKREEKEAEGRTGTIKEKGTLFFISYCDWNATLGITRSLYQMTN